MSSFYREIVNGLLELIWPTRCVGCEKHGVLLCEVCEHDLLCIDHTQACPCCSAPYGINQCTECWGREGPEPLHFSAAVSALEFDDLAARIITAYKDGGERRLAKKLAMLLYAAIPQSWLVWASVVCAIPADAKALKRREFDHMQLVCNELAVLSGLPQIQPLQKIGTADQRGMGRADRKLNASELFDLTTQPPPGSVNVLLIDDVMTTGATLNAASEVLLATQIQSIRVATVARVW